MTIEDVFVPEERVLARRPWGVLDPPLQVIVSIAMPVITAVYLGVAEAARDAAVAAVAGTPRAEDPTIQRQVGLMEDRLRVMSWALDGALRTVGDDPTPAMTTVVDVMAAKREIAIGGIEVCDLAMEVAGGGGLLPHVADRALLPRRPRRQVPPVRPRADARSTPAASPSASPPTPCESDALSR